MNKGTLAAFGAYFLWGLLPIYWKLVSNVPAFEILAHRIVWSFILLVVILAIRRQWDWARPAFSSGKTVGMFILTSILLSVNWVTYIWAVNNGYTVDASLGYFINPLVNVALGFVLLGERLRKGQLIAIGIATVGVLYLAFSNGVTLWIALTLALSFAFYGYFRKTAKLGSLEGLSLETLVLVMPAFIYLLILERQGVGTFTHASLTTNLLLIAAGITTAIPLLLFAYGAQRVTLTTLGILQYIAPSLQFIIGVTLYNEALTTNRLIGFAIIWIALIIYSGENVWQSRAKRKQSPVFI
jgi:chloramphenicol-sensitive protein RarD